MERRLTMVTAWDTERDAVEFHQAMSTTAFCLDSDATLFSNSEVTGPTKVKRRANAVVVVRGAEQDYNALFSVVGVTLPPKPPFGKLEPRSSRPRPRRPYRADEIKDNLVVSERLGILIPIRQQYTARLDEKIQLILKAQPQETLSVFVSMHFSAESVKKLLDNIEPPDEKARVADAWLTLLPHFIRKPGW
jgi:hypothetical protein